MGNARSPQRNHINWLTEGFLAHHVDAFKQYLIERGYAAIARAHGVGSIAHFAQYARDRRLRVPRSAETAVAEFLDRHLRGRRCTGAVLRDRRYLSAALGHLLLVLRDRGAIVLPVWATTPVEDELRRFYAPGSLMRFSKTL